MDMVSVGIIGLAFIILVVLCVLASKTWHWLNIVSLVLVFILGTTTITGLARVFKLRTVAIKKYQDQVEAYERATAEADKMIYGDPTSITYDPGSLRYTVEKLNRQLQGQGRAWSGGKITAEGDDRVFTFPTPRTPEIIESQPLKEVVLHAFVELPALKGVPPLASRYIGSVRVVDESSENLRLQFVAPADVKEWTEPTGTWKLYEKMPLDRRGSFKDALVALVEANPEQSEKMKMFAEQMAKGDDEIDLGLFRELLTANFLRPDLLGMAPDSKEYEQLVDRYVFDGQTIGRIENWIEGAANRKSEFVPRPEEVFYFYQFDAKSSKSFQVDATGSIETDGLFTGLGYAVDQSLHAGKEITFAAGDTVLVDSRSALGYDRDGATVKPLANEKITLKERVFIRQLRNFPYEFKNSTVQATKTNLEINDIIKSNAVQARSLKDSQDQINIRLEQTAQYESDKENLQNDENAIRAALEAKQQEQAELKQRVAAYESQIAGLYNQIREAAVQLSRRAFAGR